MAIQTRKRKKADINSLTPKLREVLHDPQGVWTLKDDDERRVRRCLEALPDRRFDVLYGVAKENRGEPVSRKLLAAALQSAEDVQPGKPARLLPYMVAHLEALVEAGMIEKRASGKASEQLYFVPPGIIAVMDRRIAEGLERFESKRLAVTPAPDETDPLPAEFRNTVEDELVPFDKIFPTIPAYRNSVASAPRYDIKPDYRLSQPPRWEAWQLALLGILGAGLVVAAVVIALLILA